MDATPYRRLVNCDVPRVERGCTSKAMFVSRGEARSSARRNRRNDGAQRPYHCCFCGWWHLGHRRQTPNPSRK